MKKLLVTMMLFLVISSTFAQTIVWRTHNQSSEYSDPGQKI
jgi:hypothetical protein